MQLKTPVDGALAAYAQAFEDRTAAFLTWYQLGEDKSINRQCLNRGQFEDLANAAAKTLRGHGIAKGDRIVHGFSENHVLDLVFRLAASMVGAVPVTVNWEADTSERVYFKIQNTAARLLIYDKGFARKYMDSLSASLAQLPLLALDQWSPSPTTSFDTPEDLCYQDEKIIIFTSGTTGMPKGVSHDYTSYAANSATFSDFWQLEADQPFAAVVTSALHHANATAICDWCMRRKGAQVHLLSRYSTLYWRLICELAEKGPPLLIAPVVSRHFDFLAELDEKGHLPVELSRLKAQLHKVHFLIGSAPVGPMTIKRILLYCGRLPVVRFGSSETCLQVMGIPPHMPFAIRMAAFERGWANAERCGYYIGRPHPGHTEVRVVAALEKGQDGFMQEVPEGQPGFLVTRGANLFVGYVNDPQSTERVMHEGWYLGLQDIGFRLQNPDDGQDDFYWMSRKSTMIIKGGANYAYDQINSELTAYLDDHLTLGQGALEIAVIGLRLRSEHEDETCATVHLLSSDTPELRNRIEQLLLGPAALGLSKGARPDHLHFGPIARNFKGAVLVDELKSTFIHTP